MTAAGSRCSALQPAVAERRRRDRGGPRPSKELKMEAPGGLKMGILIPSVSAEILQAVEDFDSTLGDLGSEFRAESA